MSLGRHTIKNSRSGGGRGRGGGRFTELDTKEVMSQTIILVSLRGYPGNRALVLQFKKAFVRQAFS